MADPSAMLIHSDVVTVQGRLHRREFRQQGEPPRLVITLHPIPGYVTGVRSCHMIADDLEDLPEPNNDVH